MNLEIKKPTEWFSLIKYAYSNPHH
jgi:hypothetical protein